MHHTTSFIRILVRDCLFILTTLGWFSLFPTLTFVQELTLSFTSYSLLLFPIGWTTLWLIRDRAARFSPSLLIGAGITPWCWSVLLVITICFPVSEATNEGIEYSLLYSNVETNNPEHQRLSSLITEHRPDFIALNEVNEDWLRSLELDQPYPFSLRAPREDNFGMAVYSRHPLGGQVDRMQVELNPPMILAPVTLPSGKPFRLGLLHLFPPLTSRHLAADRSIIEAYCKMILNEPGATVIASDLNSSPFAALFGEFSRCGSLTNAMQGRGLVATWHARSFLFRLTIDHLFTRGDVGVRSVERLPEIGSDHYPLLLRFSVH